MSDWWKPPSLLGTSAVPKKQEENPPKQRRRRRKKKSKSEDEDEGGNAEMVSIPPVICRFRMVSDAPVVVDPTTPDSPTTKKEFKFLEDATEIGANEPETKSTGSPRSPKKIGKREKKSRRDYNSEGEDSDSEGETTDSNSDDYDESDDHGDEECLESVIDRRLFELPCTHGLVKSFKSGVKTNVLKQIRAVFNKEPSVELVTEIADSIDLLRLMGASNPKLDDLGRKAREGARLYEKGMKVVSEGQDLLRSCLSDIPSLK